MPINGQTFPTQIIFRLLPLTATSAKIKYSDIMYPASLFAHKQKTLGSNSERCCLRLSKSAVTKATIQRIKITEEVLNG